MNSNIDESLNQMAKNNEISAINANTYAILALANEIEEIKDLLKGFLKHDN